MLQTMVLAVFNNAMLLLALSAIFELLNIVPSRYRRLKPMLNGLFISAICVIIMSMPYSLLPGLFFDTRSILISVTALTFGPVPTAFTVVIASAYRIMVGGIGTGPGLLVICSSALIGLAWRRWLYAKTGMKRWLSVYLMSVTVHVTMLCCMIILPYPQNHQVVQAIAVPVLVVYPIASSFLSMLLIRLQEASYFQEQLKQSETRFRALFSQAPLGYQSLDANGNFIDVNQQWLKTLGYTQDEVIGKWFGDFLTPESRDTFQARFPKFKEQGQIHSELEMLHKNGK